MELFRKLKESLRQGKSCALATITKQSGSSPRGVGAKCLINQDGVIWGSVGGGLLEAKTIEAAREALDSQRPLRLHFSLTGKDVAESDMLCGGEAEVFVEPIWAIDSSQVASIQRAASVEQRGGKGLLVTALCPEFWERGLQAKWFIVPGEDGRAEGDKPIDLRGVVQAWWGRLEKEKKPLKVQWKDDQGRDVELFLEPVVSSPVVYVFGGGHVSRKIVPLAAFVGFKVVVVDDRAEFTKQEDFPDAHQVLQMDFDKISEDLSIDDDSYLVIVTRGHIHDKSVLAQALKTKARYVGMIGSKRKRELIFRALLEEGYGKEDLARVHSPIGLEIGAETPEEIAVSIVAELIKVRAGL